MQQDIQNDILKYKSIINTNPININEYYMKLGELYEKQQMFYNAIVECYIKIIKNEPNNYVVLNQIGCCYNLLSQDKLAAHYFNKVLQIQELPDVYNNISVCYVNLKDYKNAEIVLLKSIKLNKNKDTISKLGQICYYLKKYDDSIKHYNIIDVKDVKDDYEYLYSKSFPYLASKKFKIGFELYDYRLKTNKINPQTKLYDRVEVPYDYWDGKQKINKLLVVYEQGIGDNIQYFRFIIELSKLYPEMEIFYFCREVVCNIFKNYKNITILGEVLSNNYYDKKVYIMSLPKILNKISIFPNKENYILIKEEKNLYWKNKLSHLKKPKVGFVYNGLLSSFIEKYVPLKEFELLCDLDIELICIHKKSDIEKDFSNIDASFLEKIHYFDIDKEKPFEDTIPILNNIDLLVTIDTYIVHLAGVLNIKTFLLLGYSEWRWSNDESTTYWYDSVELIRTKENRELKTTLTEVKNKIIKLFSL